jgi:hypothetical protein
MSDDWPEFTNPPCQENLLLEPPPIDESIEADWLAVQGIEIEEEHNDEGPPRISKKELREFIQAVIENRVFLSAQIQNPNSRLVGSIFLPLCLGGFRGWTDRAINNIGVIYEYYGKNQSPRSINGYPIFFSCRLLHKEDWALADRAIRKVTEAQQRALEEVENRGTEIGQTRRQRTESTLDSGEAGEGPARQEKSCQP